MAVTVVKEPLPINPHVLAWARDWAGLSEEEAANKIKKTSDSIKEWESPDSKKSPTVRQARMLAKAYGRSFLEFFLAEPPNIKDVSLVPDFRLYAASEDPRTIREMKAIQRWAEIQRENTINLYEEIGEAPIKFPGALNATIDDDPERISEVAREAIGFSQADTSHLRGNERLQIANILRSKLEANGVLVLKNSGLKNIGVRGFNLTDKPLPTVVFGQESPRAQGFTLMHEFAHIILNISSMCGYIPRAGGSKRLRKVEEWCDSFAGAFLMPEDEIFTFFPEFSKTAESVPDDYLRQIANKFCVSDHAALIRLVNLKIVASKYYWDVKKPEFDNQEYKPGGRSRYYGTRYVVGSQGRLYTKLVLQAWGSGTITNHKAAEYMGIKRLSHLNDIRKDFSS